MGKKEGEIYDPTDGYLIAVFTITEDATLPIAGSNTEAYITEIIVDGIANPVKNNATYNFTAGNHIVKWKVGETIYAYSIPQVAVAFSEIFTKKCVYIPSHVSFIQSLALRGCPFYGVDSATVYAKTPPTVGVAGIDLMYPKHVYVPKGSVDAYKSATRWSQYASAISEMTIPTVDSYIQDGLVFQLDAIDSGGRITEWVERKNGIVWYEHQGNVINNEDGAITFDGKSWLLTNDTIPDYPDSTHSIECYTNNLYGWNSIINIRNNNVAIWGDVDFHVYGAKGNNKYFLNKYSAPTEIKLSASKKFIHIQGNNFYFNGVASQETNTRNRGANGNPVIGALDTNSASTYHSAAGSKVYSIRIYNRQLTQAEIEHNHNIDIIRFNF